MILVGYPINPYCNSTKSATLKGDFYL